MPAKSKKQQQFFGLVRAVQKGQVPASKVSAGARQAAKGMTRGQVKEFAETKRKGLPTKLGKKKKRISDTGTTYT